MALSARAVLLQGDDVLQTYELNRALRRGEKPSSREEFARALLKSGSSAAPVSSHLEGIARALTAGLGGYQLGQAERAGREDERMMLADLLGRRETKNAEDQRQLAAAGVPGFTMPPPTPTPGVARAVPTAQGEHVTVPEGFDPAQPAPQQVSPQMIQAVSAMAAGGNRAAAGALGGLQFEYQDRRQQEREARAEALAQAREARALAAANRETFGAPVEVLGPDGKPMLVQFGNRGGQMPVQGVTLPPANPAADTQAHKLAVAAGMVPGSPEYQALMRAAAERLGGPATTVNVGGAEKALDKALGEQTAKALPEFRDQAQAAEKAIEASRRVTQLLNSGAITGMGAEWRLNATRALAAAGLIDGQRVKNTEALVGELARATLAAGADLKGAMSDKDIMFLREVAQGSIALTPDTLRRAADLTARASQRTIQRYNDAVAPLQQDPNMPGVTRSLFAPLAMPEWGAAAGGGPVQVRTPDEAMALPQGTPILLPDGTIGRVP